MKILNYIIDYIIKKWNYMAAMIWGTSGAEAERGFSWQPRWNPRVPSGPLGIRIILQGNERRLSACCWCCWDDKVDGLPLTSSPIRRRTHGLWEPDDDIEDGGLPAAAEEETTTSEQLEDLGRRAIWWCWSNCLRIVVGVAINWWRRGCGECDGVDELLLLNPS